MKEKELEKGMEKGMEKGIEKGLEEGARKQNQLNAKRMKDKGIDIECIQEITGLSKEEIREL